MIVNWVEGVANLALLRFLVLLFCEFIVPNVAASEPISEFSLLRDSLHQRL